MPRQRSEILKDYKHHHVLQCGHVIRSDDPQCGQNCAVDQANFQTQTTAVFYCDECYKTANGGRALNNRGKTANRRPSSQANANTLLGNNAALFDDPTTCSGSKAAKEMIFGRR